MAAVMKDLAQLNAELQEQKERVDNVDFKMITFSLSGKDYGVDIMNVKEIAKADKFTFVPNAASFVRGVYNLRGDIIPIIDLRKFFHLPAEKKTDEWENMLILRIHEQVYGTIVDKIDKVVGINSDTIQPPHPIFGDINIKYINGVVEKLGELYIILDVIRIFSQKEEEKAKTRAAEGSGEYFPPAAQAQQVEARSSAVVDSAMEFVKESLLALKRFAVTDYNGTWFARRFAEWGATRTPDTLQLQGATDADEFITPFYSPCSGTFWDDEYAGQVEKALPEMNAPSLQVWNIGCGKGYESFSFICILKNKYPNSKIKVWANDSDIMAISQATNMVFDLDEVPEYCRPYMVSGRNGYSFNQEIKDTVIFEYHDVLNGNSLPELDIILARDVISFFSAADQDKMVMEFEEKIKSRGVVILGKNEELPGTVWRNASAEPVSIFYNT